MHRYPKRFASIIANGLTHWMKMKYRFCGYKSHLLLVKHPTKFRDVEKPTLVSPVDWFSWSTTWRPTGMYPRLFLSDKKDILISISRSKKALV